MKESSIDTSTERELLIKWIDGNKRNKNSTKSKQKYLISYYNSFWIKFIKNCYIFAYIFGVENCEILHSTWKEIKDCSIDTTNNIDEWLISAWQNKFEKKTTEEENALSKWIEISPSNIIGIKIMTDYLLKEKKDFHNSYIYCVKGIKIDENEIDFWGYLGEYYLNSGEEIKYYECNMKEFENRRYHSNTFFEGVNRYGN